MFDLYSGRNQTCLKQTASIWLLDLLNVGSCASLKVRVPGNVLHVLRKLVSFVPFFRMMAEVGYSLLGEALERVFAGSDSFCDVELHE